MNEDRELTAFLYGVLAGMTVVAGIILALVVLS